MRYLESFDVANTCSSQHDTSIPQMVEGVAHIAMTLVSEVSYPYTIINM